MIVAEREGFEPSMGYQPILPKQGSAFSRSATSPWPGESVSGLVNRLDWRSEQDSNLQSPAS